MLIKADAIKQKLIDKNGFQDFAYTIEYLLFTQKPIFLNKSTEKKLYNNLEDKNKKTNRMSDLKWIILSQII